MLKSTYRGNLRLRKPFSLFIRIGGEWNEFLEFEDMLHFINLVKCKGQSKSIFGTVQYFKIIVDSNNNEWSPRAACQNQP